MERTMQRDTGINGRARTTFLDAVGVVALVYMNGYSSRHLAPKSLPMPASLVAQADIRTSHPPSATVMLLSLLAITFLVNGCMATLEEGDNYDIASSSCGVVVTFVQTFKWRMTLRDLSVIYSLHSAFYNAE
ncbi:hypothetical protein CBL_05413 [Carabus blaptoides fortunei]